jgi:hypothetical protein
MEAGRTCSTSSTSPSAMRAQHLGGGLGRDRGLGGPGQLGPVGEAGQELLPVPVGLGGPAGVPALVEHPAQQVRELGGQLGRLVDRQPVAEQVEVGPQDPVGVAAVVGAEPLHQVLQPLVALLHAAVEGIQSGGRHGNPSVVTTPAPRSPRPAVGEPRSRGGARPWCRSRPLVELLVGLGGLLQRELVDQVGQLPVVALDVGLAGDEVALVPAAGGSLRQLRSA